MSSLERSSFVQIVLSIREGHGFGFSNKPLLIVASLNKHRLESDLIQPANDPLFDIELVWEGDLKNVKRLKQSNTPVKIECFSILGPQKQNRIGCLLLSLRQAITVSKEKKNAPAATWHKLVGVRPDLKNSNPEMLLALSLKDIPSLNDPTDANVEEVVLNEVPEVQLKLDSNFLTPILMADKGFVQLGPQQSCNNLFQFRITISSLTNFDSEIGGQFVSIAYSVLGYDMQCKANLRHSNDSIEVEDTKLIVLRSNLEVLKNYFTANKIIFKFRNDSVSDLGQTVLDLKNLITTESLSQFDNENGALLNATCQIQLNGKSNYSKLSMNVCVQLSHDENKTTGSQPSMESNSHGDELKDSTTENLVKSSPNSSKQMLPRTGMVTDSDSINEQSKQHRNSNHERNQTILQEMGREKYTSDGSLHHYTLNISFDNVIFEKLPANGKFRLRVNHPSAEVICIPHEDVSIGEVNRICHLSHIEAELRMRANSLQIHSKLRQESPVVEICDSDGIFASANLDLGTILSQNKVDIERPKSLETSLMCNTQKVGVLIVKLWLRDCGVLSKQGIHSNYAASHENKDIALDKNLAERIVEELEDWKERQKELFKIELKKTEYDHLAMLTSESMRRRKEIEDNLFENVNKYQRMAESLNEANEKIKESARENEERARTLKLKEADLDRKFNIKLQELREASKRMEADVNHKLSLASTERNELLDRINHMIKAERRLEKVNQALEIELENLRSNSVSKDQLAKVTQDLKDTQEKLNSALESKAFYKSQWGKAVREVHKLKRELQLSMDKQLQRERLELYKLKLGQQVKEQEDEMLGDRSMLHNLQKEAQDFLLNRKCSTY